MTEDQDSKEADVGSKTYTNKAKDKKSRLLQPLTKIILRRLPPTMTEETFMEQVSPIPEHDYFYFSKPDASLGGNNYSRACINFVNIDDIYLFRDKFDGYVFLDEKGVEYVGIVEYSPFQRIPKKKKKKDPKCGTIETDPIFQEFLESLKDQEVESQPKLEYSYPVNEGVDKKAITTPLLDFLAARKQDKRVRDERRRRENDKRKMRILKSKDGTIKKTLDLSEEEPNEDGSDCHEYTYVNNNWYGEQRVYHKSKIKYELKNSSSQESDELVTKDIDWDAHFPALSMKTHNTFTITSGMICEKNDIYETNQKSAGDTYVKSHFEEDLGDVDVKKTNPGEWEKDKSKSKDEQKLVENKDDVIFESKSYKDQRKSIAVGVSDNKKKFGDKKDEEFRDDDKSERKRDKYKESPREQKSKKYSETRKERLKTNDVIKVEKSLTAKLSSMQAGDKVNDVKIKSLNNDDIKPFTQLPQVKTDDLAKVIEEMDRKMKMEEQAHDSKFRDSTDMYDMDARVLSSKIRRNSIDYSESPEDEYGSAFRQRSIDESSKSSREDSVEKERIDGDDRRSESSRRIRNKDRPSLVIYQPGMGKFSKQRLAKEKEHVSTTKGVNDSEKRDT